MKFVIEHCRNLTELVQNMEIVRKVYNVDPSEIVKSVEEVKKLPDFNPDTDWVNVNLEKY